MQPATIEKSSTLRTKGMRKSSGLLPNYQLQGFTRHLRPNLDNIDAHEGKNSITAPPTTEQEVGASGYDHSRVRQSLI